ncbi:MAG: class B sortase [Lachnospiraceae bacterium]|nr:class B sortase [Lachnospiraceae bacterium]
MKRFDTLLVVIVVTASLTGLLAGGYVFFGYQKGRAGYEQTARTYTGSPEKESEKKKDTEEKKETEENRNEGDTQKIGEAETEAVLPENAPERIAIDWDNLKKEAPDLVGWITLPSVELSYPIVQGRDNAQYLHHGIQGEELYAGSIFLDAGNQADFSNYNTIVYGHNMRDGTMFAKLKDYTEPETYQKCPYFWIYTAQADYLYEICSVYQSAPEQAPYVLRFASHSDYLDWLYQIKKRSGIQTDVALSEGDRIVTLSTCSGDAAKRQIVQGVRIASQNPVPWNP